MTKHKIIAIFIGIAAAAAAGFLVLRNGNAPTSGGPALVARSWGLEDKGLKDKGEEGDRGGKGETIGDWATYENGSFGFSLKHLPEFRVSEFGDKGGQVILFQGTEGREFQIFITEFDEPGPLTVERIRRDMPELNIENVQKFQIPNSKFQTNSTDQISKLQTDALAFFSYGEGVGKTREAWFIWPREPTNGNYLFQVTAKEDFDEELSRIMATFTFD